MRISHPPRMAQLRHNCATEKRFKDRSLNRNWRNSPQLRHNCATSRPPENNGLRVVWRNSGAIATPREVDARYEMDLDDGVMINSAALWPPLEPQWKDPKKWWKELANTDGKKDYDWAHLAKRYFPDRVDGKCKGDPSLAVAHGCFWKYHAEKAYQWELRLQDEIRPTSRSTRTAPTRPAPRSRRSSRTRSRSWSPKQHQRRQRKKAKAGESDADGDDDEAQRELDLDDEAR